MSGKQEQLELNFPDDAEKKDDKKLADGEDLKVEIVDDTPDADKGRKPLPQDVKEELDNDNLEEYSEKVKRRIDQARKAYHDERREKERAAREREEAVRVAEQLYRENKALKQRYSDGEKVFVTEVTKAATSELESAKTALKAALADGDPDRIVTAQEKLSDAKYKLHQYENFKPTSLQEDEDDVQGAQRLQQPRVVPDDKAKAWKENNTWFGKNKGMTAFALGLHEELVESGVDPRSDEYYDRLDKTIRKRFPEEFDEPAPANAERRTESTSSQRAKPATVVAPATRSSAPRQVRLTASQLAIAKKFNLTPEQYAREMIKLETNNG